MKLYPSVLYFVLLLTLPACGVVETFQEMGKQTEAACTAIENEIGSRPVIRWNIENGTLSEVNVYFNDLASEDMTVAEIKQAVRKSIDSCMDDQPQSLLVTIDVSD